VSHSQTDSQLEHKTDEKTTKCKQQKTKKQQHIQLVQPTSPTVSFVAYDCLSICVPTQLAFHIAS
jgi:hypothetical protein